ncbi:MAG: RDD family protein [Clostridia bacterium]|nr:RDD family protein [Clostridia bacterium]
MENLSYSNDLGEPNYVPPILAGRGERFLAKLIDSAIILGIGFASVLVGSAVDREGMAMLAMLSAGLLALLGYQAYLLSARGQTIGKMVMKIKIIKTDTGENGGFLYNFLLRSVVNYLIASVVPFYGLVDTLMIFSEDKRCIHDRLAGTKVVVAF